MVTIGAICKCMHIPVPVLLLVLVLVLLLVVVLISPDQTKTIRQLGGSMLTI